MFVSYPKLCVAPDCFHGRLQRASDKQAIHRLSQIDQPRAALLALLVGPEAAPDSVVGRCLWPFLRGISLWPATGAAQRLACRTPRCSEACFSQPRRGPASRCARLCLLGLLTAAAPPRQRPGTARPAASVLQAGCKIVCHHAWRSAAADRLGASLCCGLACGITSYVLFSYDCSCAGVHRRPCAAAGASSCRRRQRRVPRRLQRQPRRGAKGKACHVPAHARNRLAPRCYTWTALDC
jgi:hypothetical protein